MARTNRKKTTPTPTSTTQIVKNVTLPSIEELFKSAFVRTKKKILSYFLVWCISVGIFIAFVLIIGIVAVGVFAATKVNPAHVAGLASIAPLLAILLIAVFVAFVYLTTWMGLTLTKVVISEQPLSAIAAFKTTRRLVWGYVWLSVLMLLFMFGLFPFFALSIGVVALLWGAWATFTMYVYLDRQPKGLKSLWVSKAMVRQNFWGVFGRVSLIMFASFVVGALLGGGFKISEANHTPPSAFGGGLNFLFSIIMQPFIIAYIYELYKRLKSVKDAKAPGMWVGLSALGWVLVVVLGMSAASYFPTLMRNIQRNNKRYPSPYMQQNSPFYPMGSPTREPLLYE